MAEVCNAVPEHFLGSSGDDAVTLPLIALGGVGIISVASNEIPREMAEMTRAALNNDWETARRIHRKYLPLMQANFIESNPLPVKAVLAMMGKIEEVYRLPCCPCGAIRVRRLQKIATEAGLITKAAPRPRMRSISTSTKTGWRDRTRLWCTARIAASAITAKDAPRDTMPTTRAGTARSNARRSPRGRAQYGGSADSERVQVHLSQYLVPST